MEKKSIDWELVEKEYRIGVKTLREIGSQCGCTEGAIRKRAKAENWTRDLSAKIAAKTEELVRKEQVRKSVRKANQSDDSFIVEEVAASQAQVVLTQRKDVSKARNVVTALFEELEGQIGDTVTDLKQLGNLMATPDDKGMDKLNDIYHKVISLPGRTDTAKKLSESLRVLIELERKVLRIKDEPEVTATVVMKADPNLSPADAYLRMLGKK